MNQDIRYFLLLIALLIVPKILLRFRIPSGITAMALGVSTAVFLGWFENSSLLLMLSTLGITSLFLFAGLEINYYELKGDMKILLKHTVKSLLTILILSGILMPSLSLSFRPSIILALGLLTPSTGFILNSLSNFKFTNEQRYWISSKAIANEVLAIVIMFFTLQSDSIGQLSLSFGGLLLMIAIVPLLFRFFLKIVAPFAPDSEVTFLILLAFVCGVITREMGTYYLIGAFIVGVVAAQFRHFVRTGNSEKMFYAVGFFATLLIPFYFFKAGLNLGKSEFSWLGIAYGVAFVVIFVPVRYGSVLLSVHLFLKEHWKDRLEVSVSLMPTLIFGLVMSSILSSRFQVDNDIVTGLLVYTIVSSLLPTFILEKAPPEEYDTAFMVDSKKQ